VQQEPIVAFTAGQLRMGRAPALLVVDFLVCFADCLQALWAVILPFA